MRVRAKSWRGMRMTIAVLAVGISLIGLAPARAASASAVFTVRATVVASCRLDAERLLSLVDAGSARATVCLPTIPPSTILAPQPTVALTVNAATDISMLTVRF